VRIFDSFFCGFFFFDFCFHSVAATESPVIFLGTGEYMEDLDPFEPETFVSKLLGMGDVKGMIDLLKEAVPKESQPALAKRMQAGDFSLRDMKEQFFNMLKMGPLNKVMEMLPGPWASMMAGKGDQGGEKVKSYITIMDSMTDQELDNPKVINESRISRVARGSGRSVKEVKELMAQYKIFEKAIKVRPFFCTQLKEILPSLLLTFYILQVVGKGGRGRGGLSQMANMIPQQLRQQMGGGGNLNSWMRKLQGMGGMGGLGLK